MIQIIHDFCKFYQADNYEDAQSYPPEKISTNSNSDTFSA